MLYKFGVKWGVIDKPTQKPKNNTTQKPKFVHSAQRWNTLYSPKPKNNIIKRGDNIRIKTLDIITKCIKVTPKRVYFRKPNGVTTFCKSSNAVKL
jgi:hypothetical protein